MDRITALKIKNEPQVVSFVDSPMALSRLVAYHIFIKHPTGNPVIVMQNFPNLNESLPLPTQSAQAMPCDCQNSENAVAENGHDNSPDYSGAQSGGQCADGVCQLNWKPARPAA